MRTFKDEWLIAPLLICLVASSKLIVRAAKAFIELIKDMLCRLHHLFSTLAGKGSLFEAPQSMCACKRLR